MVHGGVITLFVVFPLINVFATEQILKEISEKIKPPPGVLKARLFHEQRDTPTGISYKLTVTRDKNKINTLIESFSRGRIMRVLSLNRGNSIYAYRFQGKTLEDYSNSKQSLKIAGTNFSLSDFTWQSLDARFLAEHAKVKEWNGEKFKRLYLYPVQKGSSSKIMLWYKDEGELVPSRFQFYVNGILTNELEIKCGSIPQRIGPGETTKLVTCYYYKMTNLNNGSYSTLEWLSHDKRKIVDPRYFELENIQE